MSESWKPRWWKTKPSRRDTIKAIMRHWKWTKSMAIHAVDVWGFYPWQKMS